MESAPSRKFGDDLTKLKKVDWKNLESGKIYYIRVRNKDQSKDVWGFNSDFIAKVVRVNDDGVRFDAMFRRGDPRHGVPTWKKDTMEVFLPKEAMTKKNMKDNTTFYVDSKAVGTRKNKGAAKNKTRNTRSVKSFFSKFF